MSRTLPKPGQSHGRNAAATGQAAAAFSRLLVVMGAVVMRMPMDVVRHMMPRMVMPMMMAVMHGGRGRRGEHQRDRNDNRQSRDDFTHERLRE